MRARAHTHTQDINIQDIEANCVPESRKHISEDTYLDESKTRSVGKNCELRILTISPTTTSVHLRLCQLPSRNTVK